MHFYCGECGKTYPIEGLDYQCQCGGLFLLHKERGEEIAPMISLGEVETPVLTRAVSGVSMNLKLDYMRPTGSFKDRGAFVMINKLKELGVREVAEDSSGNAGAAVSAYCAAAGIKCTIYLPEATSEGKIKQAKAYGAEVKKVPGSRDDVARAILEAVKTTYYASHVYNPLFFEGTKSIVPEIVRQVGVPDYIFVPVGNGTMLLGVYKGFQELGSLPRIIAVQSSRCAPVYAEFKGLPSLPQEPTAAEGIAVGSPRRMGEMLAAIKDSGGDIITVEDTQVLEVKDQLARMGIYCEPTAGAAPAGAIKYFAGKPAGGLNILVPLTGFGLKK